MISHIQNTFIKFIMVGILNTAFGYAIFALLIFMKVHYAFALLLATVIGVLFNFKTTGKIVFGSNDNRLLFKFILVYGFAYLVNIVVLKSLIHYEINVYIAGAIACILTALLSYGLNKEFVFREKVL